MKRTRKHHGHDNEERWLLTYADLITLLLGLFVILYAISKVDAGKYAEIASALNGSLKKIPGLMNVNTSSRPGKARPSGSTRSTARISGPFSGTATRRSSARNLYRPLEPAPIGSVA